GGGSPVAPPCTIFSLPLVGRWPRRGRVGVATRATSILRSPTPQGGGARPYCPKRCGAAGLLPTISSILASTSGVILLFESSALRLSLSWLSFEAPRITVETCGLALHQSSAKWCSGRPMSPPSLASFLTLASWSLPAGLSSRALS